LYTILGYQVPPGRPSQNYCSLKWTATHPADLNQVKIEGMNREEKKMYIK
jgi:hypothetical protein